MKLTDTDGFQITVGLMIMAAGTLAYFAPAIVAVARNHPRYGPITVLTVLLGWTGLGWIVAMAWALNWPRRWFPS